ncbi:DUF6305 family protein [Aminomonas paucivorans]|uniref:DUF6305 family protein n=1 Tax=Aminomonas paucivorans TaxID=81412 RepID=UPI003332DF47
MRGFKKVFLGAVLAAALALPAQAAEVALTTVGQSPDGMMVKVILKKMKVDNDYDAMMKPDALKGQKVLLAVVGGSMKGLGAAGIDKEQEKARGAALVDAARAKGMKVLVLHVGGKGRRGELSDFLATAVTPKGDAVLVVKGGNDDGFFTKLKGKNAPLTTADSVQKLQAPLTEILAGWGVGKP